MPCQGDKRSAQGLMIWQKIATRDTNTQKKKKKNKKEKKKGEKQVPAFGT